MTTKFKILCSSFQPLEACCPKRSFAVLCCGPLQSFVVIYRVSIRVRVRVRVRVVRVKVRFRVSVRLTVSIT